MREQIDEVERQLETKYSQMRAALESKDRDIQALKNRNLELKGEVKRLQSNPTQSENQAFEKLNAYVNKVDAERADQVRQLEDSLRSQAAMHELEIERHKAMIE